MISAISSKQSYDILSHWYVLTDGTQFSGREFYDSVVAELTARELPRLHTSRVAYHEGGILSGKREYLRLARERFAFDVCAAPFGTGYFFSLRFVQLPRTGWLSLLLLLLAIPLLGLFALKELLMGNAGAIAICLAVLFAVGYGIMKYSPATNTAPSPAVPPPGEANAPAAQPGPLGDMPDFDAFILNMPVVGEWYERIRRDHYYRYDSRMLYHTIVSEIVKKKVEEMTAAKGVQLLRTYEYSPILGELYKSTSLKPTPKEAGPA